METDHEFPKKLRDYEDCSIFKVPMKKDIEKKKIRGFSSAGRAPALQAGGQGFDSLNLHQSRRRHRLRIGYGEKGRTTSNDENISWKVSCGLIAQAGSVLQSKTCTLADNREVGGSSHETR